MVEVDPWMTVDDFRAEACAQLSINSSEDSLLAIRVTRKGTNNSCSTMLPSSGGLLDLLHNLDLLSSEIAPMSLDDAAYHWHRPPAHCSLDDFLVLDSGRGYLGSPSAASHETGGAASLVPGVRPGHGQLLQQQGKASFGRKLLDRCKALGALLSARGRGRDELQQHTSAESRLAADRAQQQLQEIELDMVVAVFPYGSPPPPCHSTGPSPSNSANPSPRRSITASLVGVQTERDRCGLGPVWPNHPLIRDLLMYQLAGEIAKGAIECTGDDRALRMMALFCAYQHMRALSLASDDAAAMRRSFYQQVQGGGSIIFNHNRDRNHALDARGFLSEASRIAFISSHMQQLLPKTLLDPAVANCLNTLDQVLDLRMDQGAGSVSPARLSQTDWQALLASTVARFWQQLEGLSPEECRDEYLESARCALGYGELSFRPSTVEIRTVSASASVSDGEGQSTDDALSGTSSSRSNHVDRGSIRDSSRTTGTDESCGEGTAEGGKSEPPRIETSVTSWTAEDIELTVSARGVSVAVREAGVESPGREGEGRVRKVLLHLAFDEIKAWGHSTSALSLKYSHSMGEEATGDEGTDSISVDTMDAPIIAELIGTYINMSDQRKVE